MRARSAEGGGTLEGVVAAKTNSRQVPAPFSCIPLPPTPALGMQKVALFTQSLSRMPESFVLQCSNSAKKD